MCFKGAVFFPVENLPFFFLFSEKGLDGDLLVGVSFLDLFKGDMPSFFCVCVCVFLVKVSEYCDGVFKVSLAEHKA